MPNCSCLGLSAETQESGWLGSPLLATMGLPHNLKLEAPNL